MVDGAVLRLSFRERRQRRFFARKLLKKQDLVVITQQKEVVLRATFNYLATTCF
jgi:hypothetical protein